MMNKRGNKLLISIILLALILTLVLFFLNLQNNQKTIITANAVFETADDDEIIVEESWNANPKMDLRNKTLILYNNNSLDSIEIAEYYATKRGFDNKYLCAVNLPTGEFTHFKYFLGAKKTVIEKCICNIIDKSKLEGECTVENIENISKVSPIAYLVMIKGIPEEIYSTGWSGEQQGIPFGTQFSLYLYSDNSDLSTSNPYPNQNFFGSGPGQAPDSYNSYIRSIDPKIDRVVAHGRISEITKERTFALIDRIIEFEKKGIQGNILTELPDTSANYPEIALKPLQEVTLDYDPECISYITSGGQWPYEKCRFGASGSGQIPGESNSNIKKAYNVSIFLGNDPIPNGQSAFDGFNNMLNWVKDYECTELCKDFSTEEEINNCRENSLDFFKEINTDCVGGQELLGIQIRSYPVQYVGHFPIGWGVDCCGPNERTPPIPIYENGYNDETFTDNSYILYGDHSQREQEICTTEDGTIENCYERIFVNLNGVGITNELSNPIQPGETREFTMKGRWKYPMQVVATPYIVFSLSKRLENGTSSVQKSGWATPKGEQLEEWGLWERKVNVTNNWDKPITKVYYSLKSGNYNDVPVRWLAIDAFELIDNKYNEQLMNTTRSSFNETNIGVNRAGGWASDTITRLGGIGWWGSLGHYRTGGWAFYGTDETVTAFLSGKPLGESIYRSKNWYSGMIYVDPIFRPSGVKIFFEDHIIPVSSYKPYQIKRNSRRSDQELYINAFHGSKNENITKWSISYCEGSNVTNCENNNLWIPVKTNVGAAYEQPTKIYVGEFLKNIPDQSYAMIKLNMSNPGEENKELADIAYVFLKDCTFNAECSDGNSQNGEELCIAGSCVTCGNGFIEQGEECDLNSEQCITNEGYEGERVCSVTCSLSDCTTDKYCGDGIINGIEECDYNNETETNQCSNECKIEKVNITIDIIEPKETEYINSIIPIKLFSKNAKECGYYFNNTKNIISCNNNTEFLKIIPKKLNFPESHQIIFYAKDSTTQKNITINIFVKHTRKIQIIYNNFKGKGDTTNLTHLLDKDLENLTLTIDNKINGSISFIERINLSKDKDNFNEIDLDSKISINQNKIEVNNLSSFNKTARLKLHNLEFTNPRILKNNNLCNTCTIESYINNTLTFLVDGFSTYSAEETPNENSGNNNQNNGGGGGGGSRRDPDLETESDQNNFFNFTNIFNQQSKEENNTENKSSNVIINIIEEEIARRDITAVFIMIVFNSMIIGAVFYYIIQKRDRKRRIIDLKKRNSQK